VLKRPRLPNGRYEVVMSRSLNIGSVAGTAIRIHVTFLLLLAWMRQESAPGSRILLGQISAAARD
jgi:Zn-dependent protease